MVLVEPTLLLLVLFHEQRLINSVGEYALRDTVAQEVAAATAAAG